MARILMVSKPVAPPWNDSSKNLVRDIAGHLQRHRATVMTPAGQALDAAGVASEAVYSASRSRFAPALADNARVFARLLGGRAHDVWHFFFAPNPRSSAAGALASRLRRVPTVQTVCSAPAADADLAQLLFASRTVVLSKHTEARALAAGIPRERVRRIPPAVAPLEPLSADAVSRTRAAFGLPQERALIVYPGDLEFSRGAEVSVRAHARLCRDHEVGLVLACRSKTSAARAHEQRLRALACELGSEHAVSWIGETSRIHALLGAADVIALPAETLYAKMDLPLVLIEAMWLARPIVVAQASAAAELADGGAALAVAADCDAVADALARLLASPSARIELGTRSRIAASERFDPRHVAAAYEALYDELLQ